MTRIIEAEVAVSARCQLGEGPVWDPDRGLLWVDILAGHVHAVDPATGVRTWFDAGDPVGAVGLTRSGGLVLALVDGFAVADDNGEHMTRVPGFSVDRTAIRFNDGKPDPWGNFCAGTMAWDETGRPPGSLYRLSPDGAVTELFCLGGPHPRRTGRAAPRRRHLRLRPRRNRPPPVPVRTDAITVSLRSP